MAKIMKPSAAAVRACAEALANGEAIIYPTETVYGLGVDALNEDAVSRLFSIKKRDPRKPVSIALPDLAAIEWYAELTPNARKLAMKFLPGPLTLVLRLKVDMRWLTSNGKIGIRVPANKFALDLLRGYGRPITATSANISGMKDASSHGELDRSLFPKVAVVVAASKTRFGVASTVVDATTGRLKILREGAVSRRAIENVIKTKTA